MLSEQLLSLLLAVQLTAVLSIPVDLTNRTDVGGLVQDHHINLQWLGALLKGLGPVLVPQPTSPSVVQNDNQSDGRGDTEAQTIGQSDDGADQGVQKVDQSDKRADSVAQEVDQSDSRAVVKGLPKEEALIRKPLSIDADFLESLLSSENKPTAEEGKASVQLRDEESHSEISTEKQSSSGVTEDYSAEIEGLAVSNHTGNHQENSTKQDNAAEIIEAESDITNSIDENAEVLATDVPNNLPSWYDNEGYYDDYRYPYMGTWKGALEDWGWPVLPTEAPDTVPEQIHISWGNTSSQMVVMWSAKSHGIGAVQYGIAPENFSQEVPADYEYFWYGNNEGVQHIYRAVLTDLIPGRNYSYKVQCGEEESQGFQFTAKRDHADWSPELLVYGDMGRVGGAPSLARLTAEAATGKYAAVLHVGDFAYDLHTEGGKYGDDFMNRIQNIASNLPYMTCPGNHEIEFDFNPYLTRFSMPQSPWPGSMDKMWYSFNLGPAHFISYSSEVFFTDSPEEEQYKWLLNDLTEANSHENRTLHPWIIAFGHRPMYCSNVDGDDCTTAKSRVRLGLEDLFYDQGVDIIIEAHEHSYERLWPVYNYTLHGTDYRNPNAPIHIISGAAGCNEFDGVCINPMMGPKGPWSAFRAWLPGMYGYGRLRVQNSTHVHWEQVLAVNGQVIDSAWIIQHNHRPFGEE